MDSCYTLEEITTLLESRACVIQFTASWCGPCKKVGPLLRQLGDEYGFTRVEVNVDLNQELAAQVQATSIPLVLLPGGGRVQGFDEAVLRGACKKAFGAGRPSPPHARVEAPVGETSAQKR